MGADVARAREVADCLEDDQLGPLESSYGVAPDSTLKELVDKIEASRFLQYSSSHTTMLGHDARQGAAGGHHGTRQVALRERARTNETTRAAIRRRGATSIHDTGRFKGHRRFADMRRKNMRLVMVGVALFVLAIAFFLLMLSLAPKSNDPVELMRTVGMVSGVVGGLAIAMIVGGQIGTKVQA